VPVATEPASLRVLLATPAYWPAVSFGGAIWVARELCEALAERGHAVEVVTTSLVDLERGTSVRTRTEEIGGVCVHYLATPVRYRWMGVTPSLPTTLARLGRPDVAHVIGFRDPIGTGVAAWCRLRKIPYLLEPIGMFRPRLRKLRLKHALDSLLAPLVRGAALVVATSELERRDLVEAGVHPKRIAVRPNPFPAPHPGRTGLLRTRLGIDDAPLALYVGRLGAGKGLDLLLDAISGLPEVHLALVGPADDPGVVRRVRSGSRVHVLPPSSDERPLELYGDADVFVLASDSERENFGLAAAEAAAAGVPLVVTSKTGIAEFVDGRAGIVVEPERAAIRAAVARVLDDVELAARLGAGGVEVAQELSASAVVERQEDLYRAALRA
jgi:glycosyltransferase involved in cell wall biosynthesis